MQERQTFNSKYTEIHQKSSIISLRRLCKVFVGSLCLLDLLDKVFTLQNRDLEAGNRIVFSYINSINHFYVGMEDWNVGIRMKNEIEGRVDRVI